MAQLDKASAYGAEDSGFESQWALKIFFFFTIVFLARASMDIFSVPHLTCSCPFDLKTCDAGHHAEYNTRDVMPMCLCRQVFCQEGTVPSSWFSTPSYVRNRQLNAPVLRDTNNLWMLLNI